MALEDYGALQANAGSVIPDPLAQQSQMVQLQNQRIAGQEAQQQMAMQRYALQRQQMFGQELAGFVQNPSAQGLATLFGKYPEFDKQAAEARSALDRGDVQLMGSAAALAAKGQYTEAGKMMQERADADKSAGQDNTHSAEIASLLNSGDPAKQQAALGMLSLGVGIAVGPDKAAEFLKANGLSQEPIAIGVDQRLVSPQGKQLVGATPLLENVTNPVTGASTAFNKQTGTYGAAAVNGAEGGGQASGAAPPAAGPAPSSGMTAAVNHVLGNEGGFNPSDMNGSPTNFGINEKANAAALKQMGVSGVKNLTKDQAAQIYATKYWPQSGAENLPANLQSPYFDVYVRSPAIAKKAWAQSGGDPQKFVQIASATFQAMAAKNPKAGKYANTWASRDAGNMAIATGAQAAPANAQAGAAAPAQSQVDPYTFGGAGINTKEAPPGYAWNPTHTGVVPIPGSETDPNTTGPQEIDDLARNWLATGQWGGGGGGMGGGNIPNPIKEVAMHRASQIMQQMGITANDLPKLRSQFGAAKSSLNDMTGLLSNLNASEGALRANAQQVLKTHMALEDIGIASHANPTVNAGGRKVWEQFGSGDTQARIKAYKDAVNALAVEYSKFMTSAGGMGGNAAPSDSARAQAEELNDLDMGPDAIAGHIKQMLIEADNKKSAVAATKAQIEQHLSSLLQPPPPRQSNVPSSAVNFLKSNPTPQMRHFFDQKYGVGKAAQILGS